MSYGRKVILKLDDYPDPDVSDDTEHYIRRILWWHPPSRPQPAYRFDTMDPYATSIIPVYRITIPRSRKQPEEDISTLVGERVPLEHLHPFWREGMITEALSPLPADSYIKTRWAVCTDVDDVRRKLQHKGDTDALISGQKLGEKKEHTAATAGGGNGDGEDEDALNAFLFERHNWEIDMLEMFRERVVSGLDAQLHPNIVEYRGCVHVVDPQTGRAFAVGPVLRRYACTLQDVADGNLAEDIRPPFNATSILADIKSGLSYIHSLGLVHNDVKPENIMLDATGRAIIIDFDTCRTIGSASAGAWGTPGWSMNPTVSLPENDWYALDLIEKYLKGEYDGNDYSAFD